MQIEAEVAVVTGAAGGIGAALARRLAREGAAAVVVADVDSDGAARVADEIEHAGGRARSVYCDVTSPESVRALAAFASRWAGPVGLFCSNAGVAFGTGVRAPAQQWDRSWSVNVMGHVHAAQAVLPGFRRRGRGHLLLTVSAGGLLGIPGDAPYTATKFAAMGLAEWLAIECRDSGVGVSALCPRGVRTPMLEPALLAGHPAAVAIADSGPVLEADEVAASAVDGVRADRFLILPDPTVTEEHRRRAADPEKWVGR